MQETAIFPSGNFAVSFFLRTFARELKKGALSSAGLEHLPYKQRVGGSNPSAPTTQKKPIPQPLRLWFWVQRFKDIVIKD